MEAGEKADGKRLTKKFGQRMFFSLSVRFSLRSIDVFLDIIAVLQMLGIGKNAKPAGVNHAIRVMREISKTKRNEAVI